MFEVRFNEESVVFSSKDRAVAERQYQVYRMQSATWQGEAKGKVVSFWGNGKREKAYNPHTE